MNKIFLIFFSATIIILITACSDHLLDMGASNDIIFIATNYNQDTKYSWTENDTIGIFSWQNDSHAFSIHKGLGINTAQIDYGQKHLVDSLSYYAYYPYHCNNKSNNTFNFSYARQKQYEANDLSHLSSYTFLAATNSKKSHDGNLVFNLTQLGALVHIDIIAPFSGSISELSLISFKDSFIEEGSFTITPDGIACNAEKHPTRQLFFWTI